MSYKKTMHKIISFLFVLIAFSSSAQHFCYTTETQNDWFLKHPELKANFDKLQQQAADLDKELYKTGYNLSDVLHKSAAAGNFTIPVVFHILHTGGSENISDAQVIDAVNILTRDFNSANADTSNVVIQFKNKIGNPKFDFILASKDPNGNCTNGIIRHFDTNTDWDGDLADYAYTWPPTRYLNIYVVRTIGSGAAGYTFLPGSGIPSAMDAIVILNGYVGSIGSGGSGTSRALTHEVGHWFNLPHVWGGTNQPGVACGDDGVSDTPITKGYSSCNLNNSSICTPGLVENVQNYMEYAYCQRMYTKGQATRMQNSINSPISGRNNLSTPSNLAFTGITSPGTSCVPMVDISAAPTLYVCSGKTLSLSSFTYNAAPSSYSWSADNFASIVNPTAPVTTVVFNNTGPTIVSCVVTNVNGSNTGTVSISVEDGVTQITSSSAEGFETSTLAPPAIWKVISPTSAIEKWEISNGIAASGLKSIYVPGENFNANSIAILESPSYDFKNNPGAQFSFKYAYAMQSSANKDLFKVQASKNCGGIWTDIWVPSNASLAQGSGGVTPSLYLTPVGSEWKLYNLTVHPNFFPFKNEDHVLIRFYFQEDINGTGFGNRFYLDEINFTSPVGINELTKSIDFNVYPNPTHSAFAVHFKLSNAARIKYQVTSITGAVIVQEKEKAYTEGEYEINLNTNASLTTGIYFLNFEMNGVKMSRKLVID